MLSDLTVYIVRWEPRLGYTISGVLMLWFRPRQPFQEKTRQSREDPFLTSGRGPRLTTFTRQASGARHRVSGILCHDIAIQSPLGLISAILYGLMRIAFSSWVGARQLFRDGRPYCC